MCDRVPLASRVYADLSGAGAKQYSGRCNPKGIAALYCSEHISLCVLEVLVHVQQRTIPEGYVVITIEIPDTVPLSRGSFSYAFAAKGTLPAWVVPSVIIPREYNIVLYPEAMGFDATITDIEPFTFDNRLVH